MLARGVRIDNCGEANSYFFSTLLLSTSVLFFFVDRFCVVSYCYCSLGCVWLWDMLVVVVYGGDGFVSSSFLFCFLFAFFYSVFDFFDYGWLIENGYDYGVL